MAAIQTIFPAFVVLVLLSIVNGQPCPVEQDPVQLAECAQLDVQAIIQAAKGNLKLFCNLAERYMECFKTKTRNCIGGWAAEGGFTELQNLAQWCCVNPGVAEPDECPLHRNPKCFAGDGLVSMVNGEYKPISELRAGDHVYVMDSDNKMVEDEVVMMLDSQPKKPALFYTIETLTNHKLSLTGNHFIAVKNQNELFIPANRVKSHDIVYINLNGQLEPVHVKNVTEEYKTGYYTPMTSKGTLIVNDIAASCYSNVVSHNLAHNILAPLRWWYSVGKFLAIREPFEHVENGIHWIPKTLLDLTREYLPSVLIESI
ncbi:unnamed protein product [Didymodactylos carnosus]|uniref:Uncharacterized protein n=1 Tax=Didymodactylos carnosus TaxID=1234261 RepID=A0A814NHV1_9BILA|nr:unnamed protein product [Didymodactylos carnosus]CAF1275719.1 unnamed protein product [Didymodactylos carnosus]CAF3857619.1 unnamed protein product [Didymodactylos carnosus]CAF4080781.1 unnamed protein product [Didymodactylos carnosus]